MMGRSSGLDTNSQPGNGVFEVVFGNSRVWLLATISYALIPAGSGIFMLVAAAAVCGLFWGFLYMRTGSLLLVVVGHTAWDLAIFLVMPVIKFGN